MASPDRKVSTPVQLPPVESSESDDAVGPRAPLQHTRQDEETTNDLLMRLEKASMNDRVLRRSDLAPMAALGTVVEGNEDGVRVDSVARRLLATRVSRLSRSEAGGEALLQKTRLAASEFRKILMQHDVTATKLSR
eukprot:2696127-Rhodomonas_salina.3